MLKEEIIKLLSDLVRIQSISSDKNHRDQVDESAQFVQNIFADLGLNTQTIKVPGGMPAVVAHTEIDPAKKQCFFMHTMMFNQLEMRLCGTLTLLNHK